MPEQSPADPDRIVNVMLDERSVVRRSPEIEHERQVAIFDLLEENRFSLGGDFRGPYDLFLSIEENRLLINVRDEAGIKLTVIPLPLTPFRRIIRDYFKVCESYFEAIKRGSNAQIEVLDQGRRGLHIEGSEILKDRLEGTVNIDLDTARRLFTLICVLHIRA
jgi:uncharacterized protein (UPF0262 family)